MNLNFGPVKAWFGFSRRERRSSFIMLLIIILIIGVRYIIPDSRIDIEYITDTITAGDNPHIAENHIQKVYGISDAKAEKLIPFVKPGQSGLPGAGSHSVQQNSRMDLNTSDSATLVKLPGIGPVLSARIIKYRRLLGGFARIEQLKEVYGLPAETYEAIKGRVFADSSFIARININSAAYKELIHIPYFEKYEVSAILKYRELKGRVSGISDLIDNKLITNEKATKVGPYLKYSE